jgi:phage baseplate assembly protein W
MIPQNDSELLNDFEIMPEPSKTYALNFDNKTIVGNVDGVEAVKQAVYMILNTERYEQIIFSWDFGFELSDLIGEPMSFAIPELERRITEALVQDDRISSVDDFDFQVNGGDVTVRFVVHTTEGDIDIEKVVKI